MTQKKARSQFTFGYSICLLATVIWSWSPIFIRYVYLEYDIPPLVLTYWRELLAFITLAIMLAIFSPRLLKLNTNNRGFIFAFGAFLGIFNAVFAVSVSINGAASATVLVYSSGAFTAVLAWRMFGEQLGFVKIAAVVLSITGVVLVAGANDLSNWRLNPIGLVTGLISGLGLAIYSLMGRAASMRNINPWSTVLYTFGIASFVNLLLNLLPIPLTESIGSRNIFLLGNAWIGWLLLLGLAIGPTLGGYGLYTVSLSYLPASVANIINTLEPAFTVLLAYLLLNERFLPLQMIGSLLILLSVLALRLIRE